MSEHWEDERWDSYPASERNAEVNASDAIAYLNGEIGDQELLAAPAIQPTES